jgi:signal transduction histidine kinase
LEFNLQTADFAHILNDLIESWKPTFERQEIELKTEVATSLKVAFDQSLLPVAIDNLIDNALRHTRMKQATGLGTSPTVTISLTQDSSYAILRIDDSGEGIPISARSKLFKPFAGSATDPKSGVSGLGLGLALVKRIVEGHKGNISVADAPNGGARFEVRLPVNK